MEALENRDTSARVGNCSCRCRCSWGSGENERQKLKSEHLLPIDSNWKWLVNVVCIFGMEVREGGRGWGIVGIHVAGAPMR